ncbi:permease [Natronobeatus ordinarius]|uniref:permease n=1 Tax=Natronobeatus ordinarius TaxID=2963433 RepID=UPI0020CC8C82|nr:permease [Natronobeatus ordinarius]
MIPELPADALVDSWEYFLHLLTILVPLFIGASFLVGLAQEYLPPERVEAFLRKRNRGSGNVAAAGLGAVTPFCSCSTVPVLAGLLGAGAPLGLAFSFLLASPIVNWIAVFLLLGLFSLEVTVAYVLAALLAAVVGGLVIDSLALERYVKDVQVTAGNRTITTDGGSPTCGGEGGSCSRPVGPADRSHRDRIGTAGRGALSFFWETLPYLLLGVAIGALIHGAVPQTLLHRVAGPENPFAVPLAALAGAPLYVSISGMLPIAAALADQGIPIGTVLAFVIGGAGVSIPNLILLNKLFEWRLLAVYVATVVATGITVGLTFNAFVGTIA